MAIRKKPLTLRQAIENYAEALSAKKYAYAELTRSDVIASEAVSIDKAMELDAVRRSRHFTGEKQIASEPGFDNYTDTEDRFIDQHGMSSVLY